MSSLKTGQKVGVDLFGLRVPGTGPREVEATGTVVALGHGVITLQVDRDEGAPLEVTVSAVRVFHAAWPPGL